MTDAAKRAMLDPQDLQSLLQAAREIVDSASAIALRHFRSNVPVSAKADESPVTVADRSTEARLRSEIIARFPGHGFLGEEYGNENLGADFVWVIDPIDGTKSFVSGHPLWGMLLGLLYHGKPVFGMVNMPMLREVAVGGPALGATLNGKPIHCRKVAPQQAYLCLNELPQMLAKERAVAEALLASGRFARATADCYSYVQLAAGWVDGVVDYGLEPYDYLPVLPLVEAAGGVMTDWQGRPLGRGSDGRVVAGSPAVHAHLLEVIARAGAATLAQTV